MEQKFKDYHISFIKERKAAGVTWSALTEEFKRVFKGELSSFYSITQESIRKGLERHNKRIAVNKVEKHKEAKILVFDIETAPMLGFFWGLWDQNIGLNQIEQDWYVLSFSAKWYKDEPEKTIYYDQRKAKDIEDDTILLSKIWKLLDEADVVITQNGKKFDVKKLNARFLLKGFNPPSKFRHIDTLQIAKRHFALTSNKLEYLTDKLCVKYKKLSHAKFSGFSLWKECMKGNIEAWKEMEKYNKYDVLSLEELYNVLSKWDNSINFNVYTEEDEFKCNCGGTNFKENGYFLTNSAKYQKYKCEDCGAEHRDGKNLISKEKKINLKKFL